MIGRKQVTVNRIRLVIDRERNDSGRRASEEVVQGLTLSKGSIMMDRW